MLCHYKFLHTSKSENTFIVFFHIIFMAFYWATYYLTYVVRSQNTTRVECPQYWLTHEIIILTHTQSKYFYYKMAKKIKIFNVLYI